ncbi:amidohydrolase [Parvibaculum sp.]|uniref:amidohydrolase n=1 Tax=Parvibaculum sp. TaxID=2024848 RepID=UPI002AC9EA68|nr:amidohydrolase [Parvibaculum sp.]
MINAEILSMDDNRTIANSMIYQDGLIRFVGDETDARRWLSKTGCPVREIDGEGCCVLPGFIDTHLHPIMLSIFEINADLGEVSSIEEVVRILSGKAASLEPGEWLLGLQLDEQRFSETGLPDRHVLDRICADNPLVIFCRDGHSLTANSAALRDAGIADAPQQIEGGTIEVDAENVPTGVCREAAVGIVMKRFKPPGEAQLMTATREAIRKLAVHGITSIGAILQTDEEGPGGASGRRESLMMAALAPDLPLSIYNIFIGSNPSGISQIEADGRTEPFADLKHRAFKIFSDGTLGSCTACMHQGFFDHPEKTGYLTLSLDDLYRRMRDAHLMGLQVCIHAIGDKAVATCIDLYEKLLEAHPRAGHRHRIEHASVVSPGDIPRLAQLGLVLSCQPLFIRSEAKWLPQRLGPQRLPMTYPFRSFFESDVVIAGSSDAPIESTSVLAAIECCVTRDGFTPEQVLTVDQAISMYTRNAAFIQFEELEKGTLEPGKRADFVMLDENPHRVVPRDIGKIGLVRTVRGGEVTFER